MKIKLTALLLVVCVLLSVTACTTSGNTATDSTTANSNTGTNAAQPTGIYQPDASYTTTVAVSTQSSPDAPQVSGSTAVTDKVQSTTVRTTAPYNGTTSADRANLVPDSYVNTTTDAVSVNQVGYGKNDKKIALSNGVGGKFFVVNAATNKVVYMGNTASGKYDDTNAVTVYPFDFSSVTAEGSYYIHTPVGRTYPFTIKSNPYKQVSDAMIKALYYQHCGCALESKYAGDYTHSACHNTTAQLYSDVSVRVDAFGGWHDAGDYGKYSTPANITLLQMFYAYELYNNGISHNLNIPESGDNTADILDEARYELEWLLTMQAPSGGVYHKVTTARFAGTVMPQYDMAQQYLSPISLTASAGFAAATAAAYRLYKNIDTVFAQKCLAASKKAYDFSVANENMSGFRNPSGIVTGVYGDNNAKDEIYAAAAELFRATGEQKYNTKFKALRNSSMGSFNFNQWDFAVIGSMAYYLSDKAEGSVKSAALNDLISAADRMFRASQLNVYGISLGTMDYFWGSNGALMNRANVMCTVAKLVGTTKYDQCIKDHISYLMGRNILSQCYVTGFGTKTIENPHHRPSQADGIAAPVPGLVSGGPNDRLEDETIRKFYTHETKPTSAACFMDNEWSYSTNEITIYWNSAAFYTTAYINSK